MSGYIDRIKLDLIRENPRLTGIEAENYARELAKAEAQEDANGFQQIFSKAIFGRPPAKLCILRN